MSTARTFLDFEQRIKLLNFRVVALPRFAQAGVHRRIPVSLGGYRVALTNIERKERWDEYPGTSVSGW